MEISPRSVFTQYLGTFYRSVIYIIIKLTSFMTGKMTRKPTIVVLNAGRWPHDLVTLEYVSDVIFDAFSVVDTFIWRTTHTVPAENPLNFAVFEATSNIFASFDMVHIQNTSWTQRLNQSSLWDDIHFREPVYTIVNYQLCNIISDALKSNVERKRRNIV